MIERPARHLLARAQFNTTPAGRLALALILVAGYAGFISPLIPEHHLAAALIAVYATGAIVQLLSRRRATLACEPAGLACAGTPIQLRLSIGNPGPAPLYDVGIRLFGLPPELAPQGEPPRFPLLAAGETATGAITLLPRRRGIHELPDPVAYSTFPFGLSRKRLGSARAGVLKVLPNFTPLLSLDVPIGRLHQPGGLALTSNVGESPEYIGSREYRAGDPVRRMDHRSWARTGKPAVREFQEEYYARVALVLDTFVPAGTRRPPEGFPDLEAAVSVAAALADAIARDDYIVDLFAAGPDLYLFRSGRSVAHLDQVLDILTCVDACHENPFDTIAPAIADEFGRLTAVLCVFLGWDGARERFCREAVESGAAVRVFLVGAGAVPPAVPDTGAIRVTPLSAGDVATGKVDRL